YGIGALTMAALRSGRGQPRHAQPATVGPAGPTGEAPGATVPTPEGRGEGAGDVPGPRPTTDVPTETRDPNA
ncbi:MAG: hypothetical protein ACRDYU_18515, partial [Actinomycetes bacterium]